MRKIMALSLLCGWALISAPGKNYDAPVTRWNLSRAHDTARACEDDKGNLYILAVKMNDQRAVERFLEGGFRCVPMEWLAPHAKQ